MLQCSDKEPHVYQHNVWKLIAFCARYGHTSAIELTRWPSHKVAALADTLGELLEEEAEHLKGD